MSEASSASKPIEHPKEELSKVMGELSVTTDDSNKTPPSLSNMPDDGSKSAHGLIDKETPACKKIRVIFYTHSVDIAFDDYFVIYTKNVHEDDGDKRIISDDYKKIAFDDLASTFKNPKLELDELVVCYMFDEKKEFAEYCNEIRKMLGSLKYQLSVKAIKVSAFSSQCILSILPFLKPKFLEEISHYVDQRMPDSSGMDQVARLEQWKQAEKLKMSNVFDEFPLKYATHFKRFEINERHLDENKFIRIKYFLSKLDHFEQCSLSCFGFLSNPGLVSQVLGAPVSSTAKEAVFHHFITGSDYYLEFTKPIKSCDVEIVKKKRENN